MKIILRIILLIIFTAVSANAQVLLVQQDGGSLAVAIILNCINGVTCTCSSTNQGPLCTIDGTNFEEEAQIGAVVVGGTPADDTIIIGDSSSTATWRAIANCTGNGKVLRYDASANSSGITCGTLADADIPNDITINLAATVTTNANLTNDVTSVGNATTYANDVPKAKGGLGGVTSCGAIGTDGSNHATCVPTPAPVPTPPFSSNDLSTNSKTKQWVWGRDDSVDLVGVTYKPIITNKARAATVTKVCCYSDVAGVAIGGRYVPKGVTTPAPTPSLPVPATCATPPWYTADAGCQTGLMWPVPKDAELQITVPYVAGNKSVLIVMPFTVDDD